LSDVLENDYRIRGKLTPQAKSHLKAIREPLKHLRAVSLSEQEIDKWIENALAEGYASATVNTRSSIIGQAFQLARKRVGNGPDIRHLPVNNARQGFFEKAEFEAVLPHLPEDLQDFVRFAYSTGMRKGESASLKWSQYDRNERILTLEAAHSKNRQARKIPIEGELAELIERRWQARTFKGPNGETVISPLVFHRKTLTGKGVSKTPSRATDQDLHPSMANSLPSSRDRQQAIP